MNRILKKLRTLGDGVGDLDVEDVLRIMGLTRRRSAFSSMIPAFGMLIAGGAIGAGIGLMFAPSSGRRMRQNVEDRVTNLREKFKATGGEMLADHVGTTNNGTSTTTQP